MSVILLAFIAVGAIVAIAHIANIIGAIVGRSEGRGMAAHQGSFSRCRFPASKEVNVLLVIEINYHQESQLGISRIITSPSPWIYAITR